MDTVQYNEILGAIRDGSRDRSVDYTKRDIFQKEIVYSH